MKFHLILLPSRPPFCARSHWKTGCASSPFTSTLLNSGKVTPKFFSQNGADLVLAAGLLVAELVAREAEHA